MKKFEFFSDNQNSIFTGRAFYNVYKEAEFLRSSDNIETIISKGYQIRQQLKEVAPGQCIVIEGMVLERNTPLLVKKTGPQVKVEEYEFTLNRLTGLVAAYAFENRHRFPIVKSSEAISLGLKWDNEDMEKCKVYLSAVSGTEHFYDQFAYYPLICALRKLQLKKITLEPVIKIAKIKNNDGIKLATDMMQNDHRIRNVWSYFPGSSPTDFKSALGTAPYELKSLFFGH